MEEGFKNKITSITQKVVDFEKKFNSKEIDEEVAENSILTALKNYNGDGKSLILESLDIKADSSPSDIFAENGEINVTVLEEAVSYATTIANKRGISIIGDAQIDTQINSISEQSDFNIVGVVLGANELKNMIDRYEDLSLSQRLAIAENIWNVSDEDRKTLFAKQEEAYRDAPPEVQEAVRTSHTAFNSFNQSLSDGLSSATQQYRENEDFRNYINKIGFKIDLDNMSAMTNEETAKFISLSMFFNAQQQFEAASQEEKDEIRRLYPNLSDEEQVEAYFAYRNKQKENFDKYLLVRTKEGKKDNFFSYMINKGKIAGIEIQKTIENNLNSLEYIDLEYIEMWESVATQSQILNQCTDVMNLAGIGKNSVNYDLIQGGTYVKDDLISKTIVDIGIMKQLFSEFGEHFSQDKIIDAFKIYSGTLKSFDASDIEGMTKVDANALLIMKKYLIEDGLTDEIAEFLSKQDFDGKLFSILQDDKKREMFFEQLDRFIENPEMQITDKEFHEGIRNGTVHEDYMVVNSSKKVFAEDSKTDHIHAQKRNSEALEAAIEGKSAELKDNVEKNVRKNLSGKETTSNKLKKVNPKLKNDNGEITTEENDKDKDPAETVVSGGAPKVEDQQRLQEELERQQREAAEKQIKEQDEQKKVAEKVKDEQKEQGLTTVDDKTLMGKLKQVWNKMRDPNADKSKGFFSRLKDSFIDVFKLDEVSGEKSLSVQDPNAIVDDKNPFRHIDVDEKVAIAEMNANKEAQKSQGLVVGQPDMSDDLSK